jgi:hypothetical protein
MSVQALAWVLDHSRSENTARLVLMSLANHAGVDGASAYPSIATMARQARCGESTVRKALETLQSLGELEETGTGPKGTRCFRINMEAGVAGEREVRPRPGQKPPHERKVEEHSAPARSAPPQDLRPPAGLSADPPQILRGPPAGSAPEPSLNQPLNQDSPAVVGRARTVSTEGIQGEDLAHKILGILERGVDSLTSDEPSKPPTLSAIREALERHRPSSEEATAVAIETRSIAQSQNRAPNIAALYAQRLSVRRAEAVKAA